MGNVIASSCDVCSHREVCRNKESFKSIVDQLSRQYVNVNGETIEIGDVDFVESISIVCRWNLPIGHARLRE